MGPKLGALDGSEDGVADGIGVASIANLGRLASVVDSLLSYFSLLSVSIRNAISLYESNQSVTSKVRARFVPVQSKFTVFVSIVV